MKTEEGQINVGPRDLYHGKKLRRSPAALLPIVILALLIGAVAVFFSMQKYAVYRQDGLTLYLPILGESPASDEDETMRYDPVDAEVVVVTPDFDAITSYAGEDLEPLHALFVQQSDVSEAGLRMALRRATDSEANALVLDMKPQSGKLSWYSAVDTPNLYGTNGEIDISAVIEPAKTSGMRLIAQMSCFADELLCTYSPSLALDGFWLDPGNPEVRSYVRELTDELYQLGFDEILLTNVAYPRLAEPQSGGLFDELTTIAVFIHRLTDKGEAVSGPAVSAVIDAAVLTGGADAQTGQDPAMFFKFFDRIAIYTTNSESHREAARKYTSRTDTRYIPIMRQAPEIGSYIAGY